MWIHKKGLNSTCVTDYSLLLQMIHCYYESRVTKLSNDTKFIGMLGVGGEQQTYDFNVAYIFICIICTY